MQKKTMANTPMHFVEKRKLERFNIEVPSKIEMMSTADNMEKQDLLTSNVCSGGAYFKTAQPLPVDTEISVELVLPLDKFKKQPSAYAKAQIRLTGKVLRAESNGMGICFEKDYQIQPCKEGDDSRA